MTKFYGNLADAALGEQCFVHRVHHHLKSTAHKPLRPATRTMIGLGLALIGLTALAVLAATPDRFAAATPVMADLEDWLMWRDLLSY